MSEDTGAKQRLLIVDDSKVIRVTARKILRDHFETIEAVDGENAWEILNNEGPFSLIVSDLTMPNLDGFGLLERIRDSRHPDIREIPVIIITGANDSEKTKSLASQAGATDFIGKPFDSVHLLARTQAHANARAVVHKLQQETFALAEQAATDPLTDLSNEVAFMDRSYQHLSYAIRHKTTLSIFLIEIDDYLELGRLHGKTAVEAMIRSVADNLVSEIRHEDILARTGAARFGLLLPGMNMAGIHNLSERISRSICTSPVKQGKDRINITISIGVAAPEIRRDTRLDDLLSEAARHLAVARSQGGNQAVFADSMNDTTEALAPAPVDKPVRSTEVIMELVSAGNTTEIEVGAPLELEALEVTNDELPTVECRETTDTTSPPGRFAGPVSGSPRIANPGATTGSGRDSMTAPDKLSIQEPAAPQGRAVFAFNDVESELGETIVITAPFDVHSAADSDQAERADLWNGAARAASAQTAVLSTTTPENSPTASPENDQADASDTDIQEYVEKAPSRTGFFRRLLAALRSPFRRHKKS